MACAYPQCNSSYWHPQSEHLHLHQFPRNTERAIQWAINCSRPDLIDLIPKRKPGDEFQKRVCTLHFERSCFVNDLKIRLTRFATPTIFLSKEETDKARSLGYASYIATKADRNCESRSEKLNSNQNSHCTAANTSDLFSNEGLGNCIESTIVDLNQSNNGSETIDVHKTAAVQAIESKAVEFNSNNMIQLDHTYTIPASHLHTYAKPKIANMNDLEKRDNSKIMGLLQETAQLSSNKNRLHSTLDKVATTPVPVALYQNVFSQHSSDIKSTSIDGSEENMYYYAAGLDLTQKDSDIALISEDEDNTEQMLCRMCARVHSCSKMVHIFGTSDASTQCLHKIKRLLPPSEQPYESDLLPQWVCNVCRNTLYYCDQVIQGFVLANVKLRKLFSYTEKCQGLDEDRSTRASNLQTTTIGIENTTEETLPEAQCKENIVNIPMHSFTSQEQENHVHVQPEMQITNASAPLDFEDDSDSDGMDWDGIISPIKRKAHQPTNQLRLVSNPQFIKIDSKGQVTSLSGSEVPVVIRIPREKRDFGFIKTPKTNRRKIVRIHEYQGKKIQKSHITIPTASDNKTLLCRKCDINFNSFEAALTHRFKEHAAEEILAARPN